MVLQANPMKGVTMPALYTIETCDDGKLAVCGWGPVFYTRDEQHAALVCEAANLLNGGAIREVAAGNDYENVKHAMILNIAHKAVHGTPYPWHV